MEGCACSQSCWCSTLEVVGLVASTDCKGALVFLVNANHCMLRQRGRREGQDHRSEREREGIQTMVVDWVGGPSREYLQFDATPPRSSLHLFTRLIAEDM